MQDGNEIALLFHMKILIQFAVTNQNKTGSKIDMFGEVEKGVPFEQHKGQASFHRGRNERPSRCTRLHVPLGSVSSPQSEAWAASDPRGFERVFEIHFHDLMPELYFADHLQSLLIRAERLQPLGHPEILYRCLAARISRCESALDLVAQNSQRSP